MSLAQGSTVVTLFRQACTEFDFKDKQKIRTLITVLESTAQVVAQNELFRCISFLGSSFHRFHIRIDVRPGKIQSYGQTCASSGEISLVHNFLFGTMTTLVMKSKKRETMKMSHSEPSVQNWQNSREI